MSLPKSKWDHYYSHDESTTQDNWLNKYLEFFEGGGRVLDLGCGNGSNLPFLIKQGLDIVAVDYSENAIKTINANWKVNAFVYDIRKKLPFGNDFFDIILADLSLHYFSFRETKLIVSDLYRITKMKGVMLARVNSINDKNHGSGKGKEIENNYFDNHGDRKRFFDKEMVYDIFDDDFVVTNAEEKKTSKYRAEKALWEIVTIKIA
jgi:SAM-dependent methyltransferase